VAVLTESHGPAPSVTRSCPPGAGLSELEVTP
jgi:hypothetical protein